jgi:TRAP-type C4-dicarboxylate transport system permease large subunit
VFVYRTLGLRKLAEVLYDTGRFAAISLFCIGTASAFGWLLAYFKIPAAMVATIGAMDLGVVGMGLLVAAAFLVIGCFIDAIPAIIILGTVLWPVTQSVGMHPIQFAIIGIVSLAFGLVTPPYGLCLLIACAIGEIRVIDALRDVCIILMPMLVILLLVILFPDLVLALPRLLLPKFVI